MHGTLQVVVGFGFFFYLLKTNKKQNKTKQPSLFLKTVKY